MASFKDFMQKAWAVIKRTAKRVWEYLKVAKMEWIVMVSLFALDLITKVIVQYTVNPNNPVVLIPNFLQINYTINKGAAYGSDFIVRLLTPIGARIFFSVFAVAASVAFILILIRNKGKNKLFRIGIAMFVAGAMGNCIDRMFLGYVRDFVHFTFQPYIFNIADAELIFGVVLIVIYLLFFFHDSDKRKAKDAQKQTETPSNTEAQTVSADADPADPDLAASIDETENSSSPEQDFNPEPDTVYDEYESLPQDGELSENTDGAETQQNNDTPDATEVQS